MSPLASALGMSVNPPSTTGFATSQPGFGGGGYPSGSLPGYGGQTAGPGVGYPGQSSGPGGLSGQQPGYGYQQPGALGQQQQGYGQPGFGGQQQQGYGQAAFGGQPTGYGGLTPGLGSPPGYGGQPGYPGDPSAPSECDSCLSSASHRELRVPKMPLCPSSDTSSSLIYAIEVTRYSMPFSQRIGQHVCEVSGCGSTGPQDSSGEDSPKCRGNRLPLSCRHRVIRESCRCQRTKVRKTGWAIRELCPVSPLVILTIVVTLPAPA